MKKNYSGTMCQRLVMVYSPILGVTYELQNVMVENEPLKPKKKKKDE
jgi:hypothetical protein